MTRFLLDANISPRTAAFLVDEFGIDVATVTELLPPDAPDEEVVELAIRERRVVITFDVGFGKLYYRYQRGRVGVIVLRLANQSVASVNIVLGRFFADPMSDTIPLDRSLVVIDEARIRVTGNS